MGWDLVEECTPFVVLEDLVRLLHLLKPPFAFLGAIAPVRVQD